MKLDVAPVVEKLRTDNADLFAKFSVDDVVSSLDAIDANSPFHFMSAPITDAWSAVQQEFGSAGLDAFNRTTVLTLISQFPDRARGLSYSPSILSCFESSFRRILDATQDPEFEDYRATGDIFLKDVALGMHRMFPAGAQIVVPSSSFHRAQLFRGGLGQFARFAQLLLKTGGNVGWYQIHTHPLQLEDFSPDGWDDCYLRIADMLRLHPNVRGMWGGSWFYDPALEQVSPRLTYLRQTPQDNGAHVFYSNVDIDGGALATSASRRKAYESGTYLPRAHSLIWPRQALLDWADRKRSP